MVTHFRYRTGNRYSVDVYVERRQEDADLPPGLGRKVANGRWPRYQNPAVSRRQHRVALLSHDAVGVAKEEQENGCENQEREADSGVEDGRRHDGQGGGASYEGPA